MLQDREALNCSDE